MSDWKCKLCPYDISNSRDKVAALRDYHMRTRHGSNQIVAPSGRRKKDRDGGFLDDIGEFIGDVIKNIFD
jgi:hypothetical protein